MPEQQQHEELLEESLFAPGERIAGRFRILRVIGRGGMGVVYDAIDEKLNNQRVAIKCARPGFLKRLPPEARLAREVSHFNVCKVHELHSFETARGEVDFLTMEFIEGETLSQRIKRTGPIPAEEAHAIASQICDGLAAAHRQGVVHGDLKCGNVILAQAPEGGVRAVLTDFGLAKLKRAGDSGSEGGRGGTLDYMAPELFFGESASVASDIYALGVVLHEMLTGEPPSRPARHQATGTPEVRTEGSTVTVESQRPGAEWNREVKDLAKPWHATVARCLALRPGDRFSSAEEVKEALSGKRSALLWILGATLALIFMLVFALTRMGETPTGPPVRLAVLPFSGEGAALANTAGVAGDVAERLAGVRKNFTVISPNAAVEYQVDLPEKAKTMLGATHVLRARLSASGDEILANAAVTDLASGRSLQELQGAYSRKDTPALAKALIGTVTRAFGLRAGVPRESVSGEAYPFYVQGVDLMRRDSESASLAAPYFNKAIALDPRSALPYAGLAETQIQMFRNNHGRKWLELGGQTVAKAKSLNPDSVAVLLVSGLLDQEHGWYEQAIQEYSRAAELEQANSDAWLRLAGAYDATNRPGDAIAAYQKAIAAQPDYYLNYLSFGNFYYYRGQYSEAERQYRHVTAIAPQLEHGHSSVGLVLMDQGRYREAEQEMLTALGLRETQRILNNLGALYDYEGRDRDAVGFYEKSLAVGPPTIQLYLNLGNTYRRLGRSRESLAAYRRGGAMAESKVAGNPRDPYSRACFGLFCAHLGDQRRADFELAQALEMAPENAKVLRLAALAYEVLRQREKTLAVLQNAPAYVVSELNRHQDLNELQQDPRFAELVSRTRRTP